MPKRYSRQFCKMVAELICVQKEDGIYAYVIGKELFIRRFSIDKLKKEITIISDNPKYPAKTYPMDQEGLQVLGKVVFWIHVE